MNTSSAPYFFMSYSREDTVKQRRIVKELRERGINIWVDVENLTPGTPTWEREIEKAIRAATGIIVLLSPESNNSEWVRREIGPIATPDFIQWAPGLPKTRSGKIMRRILRKIAANEHDQLGDISTLADPLVVPVLVNERLNR